jgi:hypothetical protein
VIVQTSEVRRIVCVADDTSRKLAKQSAQQRRPQKYFAPNQIVIINNSEVVSALGTTSFTPSIQKNDDNITVSYVVEYC